MRRPFNEAKYKALLEGLEASEVLLSKINLGDRYDAEYFDKEDIKIEKLLKRKESIELRKFGRFVASAFYPAATQLYSTGDTPFIRCVDCINFPLITKEQNNLFEKIPYQFAITNKGVSFLNKGDLVITKVGTPGYSSLVYEYDIVALSRTVLGIKNLKNINIYYLLAFLRSKFGFSQLQRERELTIQYQLTLERVKKTLIFIPSVLFQKKIEKLIVKNISLLNLSKQTYWKAENLFLQSIGLKNFKPTKESINVKSFKDSFLTSGRLDAEYYQPKYEDYLELIYNYSQGVGCLGNVVHLKDKNVTPKDAIEYKYIELSDIGKLGEITGCTFAPGDELPSRARRKVNAGDVIISSIEGSLESCALVDREYDNALCSTGFYVINSDKINAETLLVLFKSEPMQNILKQHCSGTILTAINKDEFLNIPLPLIAKPIQDTIKGKIQESMKLRKQSEQLLETAKRAVEIAIEQSEEKGLAYIASRKEVDANGE